MNNQDIIKNEEPVIIEDVHLEEITWTDNQYLINKTGEHACLGEFYVTELTLTEDEDMEITFKNKKHTFSIKERHIRFKVK